MAAIGRVAASVPLRAASATNKAADSQKPQRFTAKAEYTNGRVGDLVVFGSVGSFPCRRGFGAVAVPPGNSAPRPIPAGYGTDAQQILIPNRYGCAFLDFLTTDVHKSSIRGRLSLKERFSQLSASSFKSNNLNAGHQGHP